MVCRGTLTVCIFTVRNTSALSSLLQLFQMLTLESILYTYNPNNHINDDTLACVRKIVSYEFLGLVAEPASPAEAGAGCLSGPAGLGGKIYGITSLRITCDL